MAMQVKKQVGKKIFQYKQTRPQVLQVHEADVIVLVDARLYCCTANLSHVNIFYCIVAQSPLGDLSTAEAFHFTLLMLSCIFCMSFDIVNLAKISSFTPIEFFNSPHPRFT